ncbi:MAG: lamin tail domain-containing protein [Myxococcota bacterium]
MLPRLVSLSVLFAAGCGEADPDDPVPTGSEPAEFFRTKADGGFNGGYDYCDGATTCAAGEGDCDNSAQCDAGLVCVNDLGDNFGLAWTTDVCLPSHCDDNALSGDETAVDFGGSCGSICLTDIGNQDYCKPGCECSEGEGDCDTDADCGAGLVCAQNGGAAYGFHWSLDVCVSNHCSNGVQDADETAIDFGGADCGATCTGVVGDQEGYCTPGCPCARGEGDCDADSECASGLTCASNVGANFVALGNDALDDVCIDALAVGELNVGDLVITEVMFNPVAVLDSGGEWFEIYNPTSAPIDLNGLVVRDKAGAGTFTVTSSVVVGSRDQVVFVRVGAPALNGGIPFDYDYPNTFSLTDTTDQIWLQNASGTILDKVEWKATWPKPAAGSMKLGKQYYKQDNNVLENWCASTEIMSDGDAGSPTVINTNCPP